MKVKNKKIVLTVLGILIVLLSVIGITYAFFSAKIKENNKTETVIKTNELNIVFTGTQEINCSNIIPGDSCIKKFTVENISNVPVEYNIYMEKITNEFNEDLVYTLEDETGSVVGETPLPVTNKDKSYLKTGINIEANTKKTYTMKILYKYLDTPQDDYQGKSFKGTLGIDTVKTVSGGTRTSKCVPAESLHFDGTHTYGSLIAKEATELSTGNALICDVNGDGNYDENTEVFYYITTEGDYAVLSYYSPVYNGTPDTTKFSEYNKDFSAYLGPQTAIEQLPTTEQWTNINLDNYIRNIKDDAGTVRVENFKYVNSDGKRLAARMLTLDEVEIACGQKYTPADYTTTNSVPDSCGYLMEETYYYTSYNYMTGGTWLENPNSTNFGQATAISGSSKRVVSNGVDNNSYNGVRPAIEVKLSDIDIKRLDSYFQLGDYIKMTPTVTSYKIDSSKTGFEYDITLNPSEVDTWRVIKINEDKTVEMIAYTLPSSEMGFNGKTGYKNYVGYLNEIAKQFENSKYTIGSRHYGYNNQTEYLTDDSVYTIDTPWKVDYTKIASSKEEEKQGAGDIGFVKDFNLVSRALKTMETNGTYFAASRIYSNESNGIFGIRKQSTSSKTIDYTNYNILYSKMGNSTNYTTAKVRPILTLKAGLTPRGSGTAEDPYVLD